MSDDNNLSGLKADMQRRNVIATNAYGAMVDSGKLADYVLLTYRCPRGCALLHVINTPHGAIFGWPRYKVPAGANGARSSASGRAANTEDGRNHWLRRARYVDTVDTAFVQCDHLQSDLQLTDIQRDLDDEDYPRDVRLLS